mgnify:CR=1 FL=1
MLIVLCIFIPAACGKKPTFMEVQSPLANAEENQNTGSDEDNDARPNIDKPSQDQIIDILIDKPDQNPNIGKDEEYAPIDIEITPENTSKIRLGIGFEDHKDNDYNDSVICFVGKFVFDKKTGKIQSLANQNIDIFVKRNSGFSQNISFSIFAPDVRGLKPIFTATDLVKGQERDFSSVRFNLGDYIQLNLEASVFHATLPHTINRQRILIEKDRCRTEGN